MLKDATFWASKELLHREINLTGGTLPIHRDRYSAARAGCYDDKM